MASKLYYCRQTTESCKGIAYPSGTHPYVYGKSGCIYTSGCGVCSSLMVLRNLTNKVFDTKGWTSVCIAMGARSAEGTDMAKVAKYLKEKYGIAYSTTKDTAQLVAHLKKGYKAIVHVSGGGKQLFSGSGHYVFAGGIDKSGNVIVLDPYWYDGKFTLTANRRKYTKVKNDREVYVQPGALKSDITNIWLFQPTKNAAVRYSVNDVNRKKAQPAAPVIRPGTYTLTHARGVYNGWGAATKRKKVKHLTADGRKHATSTKKNADALLKAGTTVTITEVKLLSSGNLWAKIPSGYICIWEKDLNRKYIK